MIQIRKIGFVFAALFVLMGSAGIYIFEHSCKIDGADTHVYLNEQHVCQVEPTQDSCCHGPEQKDKDEDCCNDELTVIQLDYDYFHSSDDSFIAVCAPTNTLLPEIFIVEKENPNLVHASGINGPPKLLSGRDIGIAHQVFRC